MLSHSDHRQRLTLQFPTPKCTILLLHILSNNCAEHALLVTQKQSASDVDVVAAQKLWHQVQEFGTALFAAAIAFAIGISIAETNAKISAIKNLLIDEKLYIATSKAAMCFAALVYVVYDWYSSRTIIARVMKGKQSFVKGIEFRFLADVVAAVCGYMIIACAINGSRWVLAFIALHLLVGLIWIVFFYFDNLWKNLDDDTRILLISETAAHLIGFFGALLYYLFKYENTVANLFDPIEYWFEPVIVIFGFVLFSTYFSPLIVKGMMRKISNNNERLMREEENHD